MLAQVHKAVAAVAEDDLEQLDSADLSLHPALGAHFMTQFGEPSWTLLPICPGPSSDSPVYVIVLSWGSMETMFASDRATARGRKERLMAADYYDGPIDDTDSEDTKLCWEFLRNLIDGQDKICHDDAGLTDALAKRLQDLIAEANETATTLRHERDPTCDIRLILPGTFCYTSLSQSSDTATAYRFQAEKAAWDTNSGLGRFPLLARVYKWTKPLTFKPAVGIDVCFQFVPAFATPEEHQKSITDRLLNSSEGANTSNPRDYVTSKLVVANDPFGFNAPNASGGVIPTDVFGALISDKPPPNFPYKAGIAGRPDARSVVATTDTNGVAGVVLTPSRIAGDCYKLKVFALKQPNQAVHTGRIQIWRHLRIAKIVEKPPVAAYSGIPPAPAGLTGTLGTVALNKVRDAFTRMFYAATFESAAKSPHNLTADEYKQAIAAAVASAKVDATLPNYDYDQLLHDDINSPFMIWFRDQADYNARRASTTAELDLSLSASWTNMFRLLLYHLLPGFLKALNRDSLAGVTMVRAELSDSNTYLVNSQRPANWPFDTSGIGLWLRGFFLWYPESEYAKRTFPYPLHVNFMHELGHVLYLRHHYTDTDATGKRIGEAAGNHDDGDTCLMGYLPLTTHDHCGRCTLKLRGHDESKI